MKIVNKKQVWLIVLAFFVITGCALFFILPFFSRPCTVLMYGLTDAEISSYTKLLPIDTVIEKSDPENFPDDKLLKRADCIIAARDTAFMLKEAIFEPLSTKEILNVPPSLAVASKNSNGNNYGLPLQIDHYELSWEYEKLQKMQLSPPESFSVFEKALSKHPKGFEPALLFAGGDNEVLLALISSLCLAQFGYDEYTNACEILKQGRQLEELQDNPLGKTIAQLLDWTQKKYLHPEWYNMKDADVREYLNRGFGFMFFGTLSFHRSVEYQAIYKYNATRFPWIGQPDTLVAPMTVFYSKPRAKYRQLIKDLRATLIVPETGYLLAKGTGKSTAFSAARAPDVQAADTLYWAAASVRTVNGLYRDGFIDSKQADTFADSIREMIRARK